MECYKKKHASWTARLTFFQSSIPVPRSNELMVKITLAGLLDKINAKNCLESTDPA
jgi:hypothetical protein